MPQSLIDLAGLRVGAEGFLAAVLEAAGQPIWVVDPAGVIRFANPAAITALGYQDPAELLGRGSHDTIHHQRPDGTLLPADDCLLLRALATGETVTCELDWFTRRDGSLLPVSYVSVPIEMEGGRGAVVVFNDISDRLRAEQVLRERDAILAAQQGSLRRVATLVSGGAASAEVFAAIAREVGHVIGLPMVAVWRFEPDGTATVIGAWAEREQPFTAGTRWPLDGPTICAHVLRTGRPARIDDFSAIPGTIAVAARETGIHACAGAPIIVDGEVWGAMSVDAIGSEPLPPGTEDRLAEFTELVATAISNTAGREELVRLANEQAALRRVATLVARESPPEEVFAAVAGEVGRLLPISDTALLRYEDDEVAGVVATWGSRGDVLPVGTRLRIEGHNVTTEVLRTGRPARVDDYSRTSGAIGERLQRLGTGAAVGCPIVVAGRLWGVMIAVQEPVGPLPPNTEHRMAKFADLVATAISTAQARADLAASRARIVAATDEERRRVSRDLHDGAQQRLVHAVVTLKLADRALEGDDHPAAPLVVEALEQAERAIVELRELAHGILPTVLTRGGLRVAIEALAERTAVPVRVDIAVQRLPASVEATAYFVITEALTNVAKHAHARNAEVTARVAGGTLEVSVRDDGHGGARTDGPGLVGLADRLAVLGGRLQVDSPAGEGTLVVARIPLSG